ncbi:MAG TPA: hypothetical protein VN253_08395 [Kofleriaceae bacterium]|nr:hypothetical protein [Kofleriaceae bacterium]
MSPPDPHDEVVAHARATLRRLGDAAPCRDAADAVLEEIEAVWRKKPFTIGVMGDDSFARTDLLNELCGGGMFDLEGRIPGCAPVRVRRGAAMRFRAAHRDGSVEEATRPAEPETPAAEPRSKVDAARAQVGQHELALVQAERAVPRLARARPPWWAFWLWPIRWLIVRRARSKLAAWQLAKDQLAVSQRELAAEEAAAAPAPELPPLRDQFFERLRMLCSGMIGGRDVQAIELEVDGGPLPDDVEVIELSGATARLPVDVTVRVTTSHVEVASGDAGMRRALGPPVEAALGLARLPVEARARWIARRAHEVLTAQIAHLDGAVIDVEIALRNRISRLENLRMTDPDRFVPAQIERVRTQAAASIHAVLEHGGVHLGSELAQCAARWDEQLAAASTLDELRALAARIDGEGVTEYKRIADETRLLVMGGVGGSAHDLLIEVFAALRQPGLPDEHAVPPRRPPPLPPIAMLPSLSSPSPSAFAGELSGAGQWLTGLFRSVEARCTELRDKVNQRSARVRASAEAELLNAEPVLRAALLEGVERELAAGVERRTTWLANELAREQLAVDAERAALRPLVEVLEGARRDTRTLLDRISELEGAPRAATGPGVA